MGPSFPVRASTLSSTEMIDKNSSFGPDYSGEQQGKQEVLEVKNRTWKGAPGSFPNERPLSEVFLPVISNAQFLLSANVGRRNEDSPQ